MNCPSCHKDIAVSEQNFGALYTCSECQAVYFINFDGQIEYEQQVEDQAAEAPAMPSTDLATEQSSEEFFHQLENPFDSPVINSDSQNFSDVAKNISDFGNSETQIATLNYDLRIRGLDSKDIILEFKEVIQDSRFGWETAEIMKNIKAGQIVFEKLNPVIAYVLAKRLRFLGLELKWKQNVLE